MSCELAVKARCTTEEVAGYDHDQLLDICAEDIVKADAKEKVEKIAITELQLREHELALHEAERNGHLKREEVERVDRLKRE